MDDLEEAFRALEEEEKAKRGRGRPAHRVSGGRWSLEQEIAIAVELERVKRGIARERTPASIFETVAKAKGSSPRSIARFYAKHRAHARFWVIEFPRRVKLWRELLDAGLPVPFHAAELIHAMRFDVPPSEMPRFKDALRRIIGEKPRKTG